jgi:hypothetical protein
VPALTRVLVLALVWLRLQQEMPVADLLAVGLARGLQ